MSEKRIYELESRIVALQTKNHQLRQAKKDLDFERRRLRSLYELTTVQNIRLKDQINRSLKAGMEILNLDIAIVSQVISDTYIVLYFYAPNSELYTNQQFELGDTYCSLTLSADDVVAIDNMGVSEYSGHPCYQAFSLESYIGVPLRVNNQRFGTLNFSSSKAKDVPFSESDMDYVRLMGRWLSCVLEKEKSEKKIVLYKERLEDLVDRKSKQLIQAQKYEAIATLAGGIAHDFNNILSGILGFSELIEINQDNPELIKKHNNNVLKGVHRATELVKQILTFSSQSEHEKHSVKMSSIVKEALKLIRPTLPATITIREKLTSDAMIFADPTQIHQIVMNLCTNSYHAMRETGGELTIELKEIQISKHKNHGIPIQSGRYLELVVSDTGCGIKDEHFKRIFNPYFTTKNKENGTGLGLSLVYGIVEDHSGYLEVKSIRGKGSSFHIRLPVTDKQIIWKNQTRNKQSYDKGTERIMLVDDEDSIRLSMCNLLENYGYAVSSFSNGVQALNAFQQAPDQFDLIITDMTMPAMTGDNLLKQILTIRNDIPAFICTGFSDNLSEQDALGLGIKKYLQKPINFERLLSLIREVLDEKTN